jgi:hypothetical protein
MSYIRQYIEINRSGLYIFNAISSVLDMQYFFFSAVISYFNVCIYVTWDTMIFNILYGRGYI